MNPRYVPFLLLTVLFCVALVSADDQKNQPPHISKQTRMDLIRAFNSELVYIRAPFPMGKTGLTLKEGQVTPNGDDLQRMLAMWGPAVKPGDQARISQILVKNDRIHFEINGGAVKKQKWYQHIQFGGGGGMTSIAPSDPDANPRGSYVDLVFNGYVPELEPQQLKDLLRPVFDFNAKSAVEAYLDTLPPKVREAIKSHQVLVGMNRDMVMAAKGRPPKEDSRERWRTGVRRVDLRRATPGCRFCTTGWRRSHSSGNHESGWPENCAFRERSGTRAAYGGQRFSRTPVRPPNAPSLRRPGEEADPNSPAAGGRAPAPLPPPDPMGQHGPPAPPN